MNEINLLRNQIEALTKERDALKAELARPESTAVSMMRAENAELTAQLETLQYEVDAIPAIKAERDDLSARYETASRLVTSLSDALANALKERDALKSSEIGLNRYAAKLNSENTALTAERDQLQRDFTYIKKRRDALLVVLDKLARLGNGNHYGNSEGNAIAIAALNGANNA